MSLISNRKRPRGFSETFNASHTTKTSTTGTSIIGLEFDPNSLSSSSSHTIESSKKNGSITFNDSIVIDDTSESDTGGPHDGYENDYDIDGIEEVDEELDDEVIEEEDDDDDVVILEERNLGTANIRGRNNSDSALFINNDEEECAYNMFNVHSNNNNNQGGTNYNYDNSSTIIKKQRTSSLPQLPQVRCFYNRISPAIISKVPKLGNIKPTIIPYESDDMINCDDNDGHYIIKINETFANRFFIVRLLGQGTFGKVIECFDKQKNEKCAIKIIRNIPKYRDAAKIELRILLTLKKFDNDNMNHCIHLKECFDYRGHICIVTDLLKISLYDFLEQNKFISFPGSHIQAILKQLIRSITFLHDLSLIHTDLKPENILLYDDSFTKRKLNSHTIRSSYESLKKKLKKFPKFLKVLNDPSIQIIDFGSAIFNDEYHSSIVSTRHYRAPEIILGTGWSFPCDMWSTGCILVELIIGEPLFKTHDNLEHLAMIEKICGCKIDSHMVKVSKNFQNECGLKYFDINNELEFAESINTPLRFIESVERVDRIDLFISSKLGLEIDFDYSLNENFDRNRHLIDFGNFTFWWFLIDLIRKLFIISPNRRLTAYEALQHPWFNLGIEDEGTIPVKI